MASPTPTVDSLIGTNSLIEPAKSTSNNSDTPLTISPTASLSSRSSSGSLCQLKTRCELCYNTFVNPKVLPCLHTFCEDCLLRSQQTTEKFVCPHCHQVSFLSPRSIAALIPDFSVKRSIGVTEEHPKVYCTSCKHKATYAVARCYDCYNFLCSNCEMAHQVMRHFEGHRTFKLTPGSVKDVPEDGHGSDNIIVCPQHRMEALLYFCKTCNVPICVECTLVDHPAGLHNWEFLNEEAPKQFEKLNRTILDFKTKADDYKNMLGTKENLINRLKTQYLKAQNDINDTFQFYKSLLEEQKKELIKEVESVFSSKQISLDMFLQKTGEAVDKVNNACEFYEKLTKQASVIECLMFKKIIDSQLQTLFSICPNVQPIFDFEFVSNYQAIQVGIKNTFGYVRSSSDDTFEPYKQPPIARPIAGLVSNNGSCGVNNSAFINSSILSNGFNSLSERPSSTSVVPASVSSRVDANLISKRFNSMNTLGPFPTSMRSGSSLSINGVKQYEKWSVGPDIFQNFSLPLDNHEESVVETNQSFISPPLANPKSQVKRQKMIYYCKFGEFGFLEGQFTEPSGVAVNAQNDIIVADTNNHRIQIFDKEGRFKFQFGECGKRDGQFLYPNRVAVVKTSGDIIVTERSPTHQVQIYNQYGQFVRKFGANILQYPRGVAVDSRGRIIIVECKVMRVIIFDQNGNVLKKFGCSKHVEFPNGVVVNEKEEIFVSDNRAHCVKVFNYDGSFIRQIGCYGIINYPIGVGLSPTGEILIADNHNNFNLTIFTQEGQYVTALESKIKHAQCFDVALMDDGSVVLASKDYRLYIYRYVPIPPIGL